MLYHDIEVHNATHVKQYTVNTAKRDVMKQGVEYCHKKVLLNLESVLGVLLAF